MNQKDLIENGYKYICTQNNESQLELWAKFTGEKDIIAYLYYSPEGDVALEQTRRVISYTQLDMMAQMLDKMREDFCLLGIEYDKNSIWYNKLGKIK